MQQHLCKMAIIDSILIDIFCEILQFYNILHILDSYNPLILYCLSLLLKYFLKANVTLLHRSPYPFVVKQTWTYTLFVAVNSINKFSVMLYRKISIHLHISSVHHEFSYYPPNTHLCS